MPPDPPRRLDPADAVMWGDEPSMGKLAAMIRDLDAHIERRAQEIAGPAVIAAEADALRRVTEAQDEARRWKDCNAALGRTINSLERQLESTRSQLASARAEAQANGEAAAAALDREALRDA